MTIDSYEGIGGSHDIGSSMGMNGINHGATSNIDGTPMIGDVDLKGNPYGIISNHNDSVKSNVDGTPMIGNVDVNGNPYGVINNKEKHYIGEHNANQLVGGGFKIWLIISVFNLAIFLIFFRNDLWQILIKLF